MNGSFFIGIIAALFAAFVWSLNFVVPFVIGDYAVFDFALFRFVISGSVGLALLLLRRHAISGVTARDWLVAAGLAFIGYVGYFLSVAAAAIYAGPVVAPAILGLVPIVLALAGNLHQRTIAWRPLAIPLALTAGGLALVNHAAFAHIAGDMRFLVSGIGLAIVAVALWTWFGLVNQAALLARPSIESGTWTALILVTGGIEMLVFFPVGSLFGLFEIPRLGLGWHEASRLYMWGVSLAIIASAGGAWAWTVASRNLPIALGAQLIVSETVFGVVFGLAVHGRWPTAVEVAGIAVLVVGVVLAIAAFHRKDVRVAFL
jgi:drug/metabolite transporter (DMT)-like permease